MSDIVSNFSNDIDHGRYGLIQLHEVKTLHHQAEDQDCFQDSGDLITMFRVKHRNKDNLIGRDDY